MKEIIRKYPITMQIGTIVTVISFIIVTTVSVNSFQNNVETKFITMENQYEYCNKWYEDLNEKQEEIDSTNQSQDLIIVEIKTKLNNIEAMLVRLTKDL